ncbi:MAG TPA: septum formation family protein [Nocardioides sp.]|nr:septum formation family protein [Nocardioides sp.]
MARMRRLVLVAAGVLLLAGCGADPAPPVAAPTTPPTAAAPPPAPATHGCYQLTMTQAVAPTSHATATSCTAAHTTETYYVGQLDTYVAGHLLAVDSDRVSAQVSSTCRRRLGGFLGGTTAQTRLSMIRAVWFTPTVAQSGQGANWFRCDAVAVADADSLSTLRSSLRGALRAPRRRAALAMCGTAAPGTDGFHRVQCSATHNWRAIATVPIRGRHYPGVKAAKAAGKTRCLDAAAAAASNPLSFKSSYEWPTREDWSLDQHYGICWTKG